MSAVESWGSKLAQAFALLVDVLIPGDADFPSASAAGAHGLVMDRLRGRLGSDSLDEIATAIGGAAAFVQASDPERIEAIERLEQNDPALFSELRFCTYFSYYESPIVVGVLRRLGHDYNDAPQPLGYAMQPFDPAPGADLPREPRGTYKKTGEIFRIDISSLPVDSALTSDPSPSRERGETHDSHSRKGESWEVGVVSPHRHPDPVDVLVIGSGMGGAVASRVLAEAGLRVVCLEQGEWTRPEHHPHFSPDWEWQRLTNWSTAPNVRHRNDDYPVDTLDETTLMWCGVGGSTTVYTATWPRFRPSDFRKGTEHGRQPDWPYTYEDLAPWYEANDRNCGVSGVLGNPAMPPRGPYQTGPLPPGSGRAATRGFDKLGWHWWPMPAAILAEDYDGRLACNHCGNCQSGCPRGSLNDMSISHWPKAIAAGAELRTHARVARIETGPDGRATGALYIDRMTGTWHFQPASVVIMAANGVGTPRLLLNSSSSAQPDGLANSSGMVGRHLMHHGLAVVEAWVDEPLETHKGFISAQYVCEEFAETDVSRGFINGFALHIVRMNGAGYQAHGSHSGNISPWGTGHHDWFRQHFDRGFGILCVGDDLPLPENRVSLSTVIVDSDGLPAPKIDYHLHPNDERMMDFAVDRAVELAEAAGAFEIKVNRWTLPDRGYAPPAWHLLGTCRMGSNPRDAVVNQWGQSWDVPNLYIMDGSVLPTGGAVNPTSTIGAVTLRNASHLRDRFADARRETQTGA